MAITAQTGPTINYGITLSSSGAPGEYNEERGPQLNDLGEGTLDPRPAFCYKPGNAPGSPVFGWPGAFGGPVVDQIPSAVNSSGIAATQSATAGTAAPFTLTLTTSAASTNVSRVTISPASGGAPVSVLAIDGQQSGVGFGQAATIKLWDPSKMVSRCITISSTQNDSGGAYTVKGFDAYGFALSQTLTGPNNGTVTTLKAFKYILSVSASGAINSSSVKVGVSDNFGFPLRVDSPAYITVWWGNSSAATPNATIVNTVSSASHTFADQTAVATSTTGDVRGTVNPSTYAPGASNGTTNRLQMFISPSVANIATISSTNFAGLVGVPQA